MFDGPVTAREYWWFITVRYDVNRNFLARFRRRVARLKSRTPWWNLVFRCRCSEVVRELDYLLANPA